MSNSNPPFFFWKSSWALRTAAVIIECRVALSDLLRGPKSEEDIEAAACS